MSGEYPKMMKHPHYRKGTVHRVEGTDATSGRKFVDHHGTADIFPPVSVKDSASENIHRAQGYIAADEVVQPSSYQRYPIWMKKSGSDDVIANTEEQEKEFLEQGYLVPGKPDSDAMERAAATPYNPTQVVVEFPKMVDGKIVDPQAYDGSPIEYPKWVKVNGHPDQIANNAAEERAILAKHEHGGNVEQDTVSTPRRGRPPLLRVS